jgi:adenosylcobinamide amidohydrolase
MDYNKKKRQMSGEAVTMPNRAPVASSGVGGVSVFTEVGSKPMGKARNENNRARLADKLRKKKKPGTIDIGPIIL